MPSDFAEMKSSLARLLRSPWLGAFILLAAIALLALVAQDLGERLPSLPAVSRPAASGPKEFPLAKIETLLAKESLANLRVASNGVHAFFTRYFEPPPPPPPKPAPVPEPTPVPPPKPPPPATRKAALLYQGVYEAAAGQKQAFVLVESQLHILTNGSKVIADWSVAEIGLRQLKLTNAAAQTNLLEFNAAKEVEVPMVEPR